jgi:uncharacterized protein YjbJ (UPF0337 family)
MNNDILQGKWKQVKGTIKEKWGELTDNDLNQIDGKTDRLLGKLQEIYGYTKQDAEKQLNELLDDMNKPKDTSVR